MLTISETYVTNAERRSSMPDEQLVFRLEFAVREYEVATEHLMDVMSQMPDEDVPQSIIGAIILLSKAIETEWGGDPRELSNF